VQPLPRWPARFRQDRERCVQRLETETVVKPIPRTIDGVVYPTTRAAARALGISNSELRRRLDRSHALNKQRKWTANNREKLRARRRRYAGMPEPTRPCPDACEICGRAPGKRSLHLDHDHMTGTFRGWPCSNCNTAIGLLRDNPVLAERVAGYLRGTL
jgi:hypothetical protein